jgi:hypothetical protein
MYSSNRQERCIYKQASIFTRQFFFFHCIHFFALCNSFIFSWAIFPFFLFIWRVRSPIIQRRKKLCLSICCRLRTPNNEKNELLSDLTFSIACLCLCVCRGDRINPYVSWRKNMETAEGEKKKKEENN